MLQRALFLWYTKVDVKQQTKAELRYGLLRQEGEDMIIHTQKYRRLELFIKTKPGKTGTIQVISGGVYKTIRTTKYRQWIRMAVNQGTAYELYTADCDISYAYLSGVDQIMEKGVCFLQDGSTYEKQDLGEWYDTPMRTQYHFMPFKGWMNDPNGFCFYRNYYHLFYQFHPFSEEWDNMYWGHAVTKDMVHWTHLPVCIEPQTELLEDPSLVGGAFSGHAFVDQDEKMRLFFTRHISRREEPSEMMEYQVVKESRDGLEFEREEPLIQEQEKGLLKDIRDPKVFVENGIYKMLLGTGTEEYPAIALYTSRNLHHWTYDGTAFEELEADHAFPLECPDLFRTGGKWILTVGYCGHRDEAGRKNGVYYYIGEWYQDRFHPEKRGLYDFGGDLYAVQSVKTRNGIVSIGWIRDTLKEHVKSQNGGCGSMSIPRITYIRDGKLYRNPLPAIYGQIGETLYEGKDSRVKLETIKGNTYHVKLQMKEAADFRMTLFKWKDRKLYLEQQNGQTRFRTVGMGSKNILYPAETQMVTKVEVFVDRNVCEVFLNDGEDSGTKKFYQQSDMGMFEIHVHGDGAVESLKVEMMNGIWQTEKAGGGRAHDTDSVI